MERRKVCVMPCGGRNHKRLCLASLRKNLMERVPRLLRRVGCSITSIQHYSSSPDQRLAGQVAVITGGASGIGAATARLFTSHGARVVIADIEPSLGEKVRNELGPQAVFVKCDVRNEEDIANAIDTAYSLEKRLDILYSNAGIVGAVGPIDELNTAEYDDTIAVDLRAAVLGVKHAARVMKLRKKGSIVITGSTAGSLGGMGPHAYSIAKGALVAVVKSTAAELGKHGIRVNMISPEVVATPLAAWAFSALNQKVTVEDLDTVLADTTGLLGRHLMELDIANAALYLASDMGGYVSGHNLAVDAGSTTTKVPVSGWYDEYLVDKESSSGWYSKYMPSIREHGRRGL